MQALAKIIQILILISGVCLNSFSFVITYDKTPEWHNEFHPLEAMASPYES